MDKRLKILLSVVSLFVLVLGFYGFSLVRNQTAETIDVATEQALPDDWHLVDARSFTLSLPPNWKFNTLQGIDSYVAEFVGDGVTLDFDYGFYSNPLAGERDPRSVVTYVVTYETIDGRKAKIVVPKDIGNGTTGVYVEDVGDGMNSLQISGENLTSSQQDVVLKIFRALQFVEKET